MNIVKLLHDTALDYYDKAKLSKIKGDQKAYYDGVKKAFLLEKEAALKMPIEEANNYWQYMLIRSAAWLAFHCKEYEQALQLANWGLTAGEPPAYEKAHLDHLLQETIQKISLTKKEIDQINTPIELFGLLAAANVDTGNIKVRANGKIN